MEIIKDGTMVVMFIGAMAFIVSCITEVIKHWEWLDKRIPTAVTVVLLSVILCPITLCGLAKYYDMVLDWFMVFSSFIAAFIVALVSMDGWEKINELKERFIRGQE